MNTFFRVIKHKRFMIGFVLFSGILIASITFNSLIRPLYPAHFDPLAYNKEGNLIAKAPFPATLAHPLGTDGMGVPYELLLLPGAKQLIWMAIAITFIRVFLSLFAGIVIASLKNSAFKIIIHILDVFQFIPGTLLAFMVLAPVPAQGQTTVLWITVLSLVAVPNLSSLFAVEINEVKKREFIDVSKTMGGGYWHIFRSHILSFLKSKLVIIFNQQIVQVLVLMIALALLYVTFVNWMNFIAIGIWRIWVWRWMLIDPAAAVFLIIVSVQLMASAIRRVAEGEDIRVKRKKEAEEGHAGKIEESDFTYVRKPQAARLSGSSQSSDANGKEMFYLKGNG
ncbi:MAG: hypothetical protein ACO1OC_01225 [Tuberibacillus sp.]